MSFFIHEDDRRILYDWAQGNFKSAKAVIVKEDVSIGGHKHDNKEEQFFLLQGKLLEIEIGNYTQYNMKAPFFFVVPKGVYHSFTCEKGSILLGVATELFDESDEIK